MFYGSRLQIIPGTLFDFTIVFNYDSSSVLNTTLLSHSVAWSVGWLVVVSHQHSFEACKLVLLCSAKGGGPKK